ncbi:MAG: Rhodanese domain protein [Acidimicrobiales bacterium]|nr:Rhodanese domain protein [Acidimicrobiales bacterium]
MRVERSASELSRIAARLAEVRERLDRVPPERLAVEVAAGALVVDIRPVTDRIRHGALPGAVAVDRNVLEWRLDPTSPDRLATVNDRLDRRIIVVCNDGYASSLAAVQLQDIGLTGATDLEGGYHAWRTHVAAPAATGTP